MTDLEPYRRAIHQGILVEDVRGNKFNFSVNDLVKVKSSSRVTRPAWFRENRFPLTTLTNKSIGGPALPDLVGALQNPLIATGAASFDFDTNPDLRVAVAAHLIAPYRVLASLVSKNSNAATRRTVAMRPNLPNGIQKILASDSTPTVLSALSQNVTAEDEWRTFAWLSLTSFS